MKVWRLAALLCSASTAAAATEMTIRLPQVPSVSRNVVAYQCGKGERLQVEYINAGANGLAVVPVSGEVLIFASVLSGSGARYAAGPFVWWTKGRAADLYDLRKGEKAKPVTCKEVDAP